MNKKFLVGTVMMLMMTTLTGCQVHFGRDAVTIGKVREVKQKQKKQSSSKKTVPKKKVVKKDKQKAKPKKKNIKISVWNRTKTKKLQAAVIKWGRTAGQKYQMYDGKKQLSTKKGATYPDALKQKRFLLNKKSIKISYSLLGKNQTQYNVVAIANADFKTWHNTYLFCLKDKKPVILLDQSKNGNPIIVKNVKDKKLNQIFSKIYR